MQPWPNYFGLMFYTSSLLNHREDNSDGHITNQITVSIKCKKFPVQRIGIYLSTIQLIKDIQFEKFSENSQGILERGAR